MENYFRERVKEQRGKGGTDLLSVLCQTEDEDGNKFSDEDIVNHMIFLMMAAHDTSTSTSTTMAYQLAAHPEWQHAAATNRTASATGHSTSNRWRSWSRSTW